MKLLFVYNAKSGKINTLFDVGHKLINPSTYACKLCELTHGVFKEKEIWKRFREESLIDMEFYHSDEFESKYPELNFTYPIILKEENKVLTPLVDRDQLNNTQDVEELIQSIKLNHS